MELKCFVLQAVPLKKLKTEKKTKTNKQKQQKTTNTNCAQEMQHLG